MRSAASNVKPLAPGDGIWHRFAMSDDSDIKQKQRAERLREALRANLRRRKMKVEKGTPEKAKLETAGSDGASCPKSAG